MAIPEYQRLMLPLLQMAQDGNDIALQDAVQKLADEFHLTPEETAQRLPSGQTFIYNRTGWAKTELVKAGLIDQPRRGLFRITARGKELLSNPPPAITRAYLVERYPEFRAYIEASQRREAPAEEAVTNTPADLAAEPVGATPEELIDAAEKTLTAALEADLLDRIRAVHPTQFEQIVVDLLIAMGFGGGDPEMGQRLGRSGDGGIDGVIQEDALGLDAVYVQAKRYQDGNTIGAPTLQGFVGSLVGNRANKGVFVTSSKFSAQAKAYVSTIQHRVVLIDGEEFARLLVRHGVGVRVDRKVEIKKLDENYFDD
ncbi:restriction endonuclease [Hyphomicrobium sp. MC8b]|uniref:restriction endonuclease n=1 Tax=Hyphomicrobium sp. MC8b TaxID=300273 RepID=UPI00391DB7BC